MRRYIAHVKLKKYKHIWPINEQAATPPAGWKGWPNRKKFALVLQHDVDTLKGHNNCRNLMDLEEKLGVRSTFYIVPELYPVSRKLLDEIKQRGFGLGVHGLKHNGKLFLSYNDFRKKAKRINSYMRDWGVRGFSSPSMISNLAWMHHLDIDYSTSTVDTDPFEPQPTSVNTIFPLVVYDESGKKCFVELPYTLPQDFTLFIILQERSIDIWKKKLEWVARHGGMALVNVHPDYIRFETSNKYSDDSYPCRYFSDFINYLKNEYSDQFWNACHHDVAKFIMSIKGDSK